MGLAGIMYWSPWCAVAQYTQTEFEFLVCKVDKDCEETWDSSCSLFITRNIPYWTISDVCFPTPLFYCGNVDVSPPLGTYETHLSCHYTHSKGDCHWAVLMASEVTPQELSGAAYLRHISCSSPKAPLALVLNTNSFKCVKSPSNTALAELHKATIFMYYLCTWFNIFSDTFLSSPCPLDQVNLRMPFINLQPLSRVSLHLRDIPSLSSYFPLEIF